MRRRILGQPKPTYYGWGVGQPAPQHYWQYGQPPPPQHYGWDIGQGVGDAPAPQHYWQYGTPPPPQHYGWDVGRLGQEPGLSPTAWPYTLGAVARHPSEHVAPRASTFGAVGQADAATRLDQINHWMGWLRGGAWGEEGPARFLYLIVRDVPPPYSAMEIVVLREAEQHGVSKEALNALVAMQAPAAAPEAGAEPPPEVVAVRKGVPWYIWAAGAAVVGGFALVAMRPRRTATAGW